MKPWKEKVLGKVKEKITKFKENLKPKQTKPVLSDPDIKNHLEELRGKFVTVTIDKTSNKFVFICRKLHCQAISSFSK